MFHKIGAVWTLQVDSEQQLGHCDILDKTQLSTQERPFTDFIGFMTGLVKVILSFMDARQQKVHDLQHYNLLFKV